MHILQLDLGREWRGGQRQVRYLMRHLAEADGFETTVGTPVGSPLGERMRDEGGAVLDLASRRVWDPRNKMRLRRFVKQHGVQVVNTHCARSAALGAWLKKKTGIRLVHSRRVSYKSASSKYLAADAVAAVSGEIARTLTESGVSNERVHVIHSGIDPHLYAEAAAMKRADPPVIGVIGALTPQKGHAVLLEALAALAEGGTEWKVRIVGKGRLYGELQAQVERLGLARRVQFLGYRESREVIGRFSMLVVPSVDGEGSSGTIKEGWAAGVPVICSDLPSNLELVESGISGLAFPNRDAPALATTIDRLFVDMALRQRLVHGGMERLKQFTDAAMARAYMKLYRRLG